VRASWLPEIRRAAKAARAGRLAVVHSWVMSEVALTLTHRRKSAGPTLSGWGRLPVPGRECLDEDLGAITRGAVLTRGLGRSYGDSSLPARPEDRVVGSRLANRILAFDPASGRIRVEAGVCLADLNRLFMPRGFFTPVTPGTKYVTVGGMVASDVHGKNHHREGCFGAHVRALRLRMADDGVVDCSATVEPDLFFGTIGGMGLLGHILEVEFDLHRIPSPWIVMDSRRVDDIDAYVAALNAAAPEWPMTMGWIDCLNRGRRLGRGILMAGRWATAEEAPAGAPREKRKKTLPFELPNWALNPLTARAFNTLYYWKHLARHRQAVIGYEPFFYPLDAILHWNRGYGARGFTQYQCVLPRAAGPEAVRAFMELLTKLGGASPLCVIKDCGAEGRGVLSFPMPGTSIAVDMAVSPDVQGIVDRLNEFVIAAKGRIYLTKDRFTRAEHFRAMEPRLDRFLELRRKYDPQGRLKSAQSVRLFGDRP
jgi:FAD/FMN-containing dehydrogenase